MKNLITSVSTSVPILIQMFTRGQALCYVLVTEMKRTKSLTLNLLKSIVKGKYKEALYMVISVLRDMIKVLQEPGLENNSFYEGIRDGFNGQ